MDICQVTIALLASLLAGSSSADMRHLVPSSDSPWYHDYAHHYTDSLKHGAKPFKRLPNEDKAFKKSVALESHCHEVSVKEDSSANAKMADSKKERIKCYRCKDPRNGATYEQCSYSSRQPSRRARSNSGVERTLDSLTAGSGPKERKPAAGGTVDEYPPDNCKKVVKNSMLCMACRDPKTQARYEQCSYAPTEKAYAYTKSSSFGGQPYEQQQQQQQQHSEEVTKKPHHEEYDESSSGEEAHGSRYVADHHYPSYYGSYEGGSDDDDDGDEPRNQSSDGASNCRTVQKDGESCQVCKDPGTGGESESCNYAYEPKDKAFAYSQSKSFGYPDKSAEASGEEYYGLPQDYAESEKVSRQVRERGRCRKLKRGSAICTVCKDPDNERCEHAYEPDDKHEEEEETYGLPLVYATGKSDSNNEQQQQNEETTDSVVGSKVDDGFYSATQRRAEIEKIVAGEQDRARCDKTYRDGMTCFKCRDARTKGVSEECVYATDEEQSKELTTTVKPSLLAKNVRKARDTEDRDEETEPYDFVAETRPVYDKVLGMTLPAYMLLRSHQEVDFDESVEHSRSS